MLAGASPAASASPTEPNSLEDVRALYRSSARELRRRIDELQTLYRMSDALGKAVALPDIYEQAIDGLMNTVKADRASVLVFESDAVMRFKAWRGLSQTYRAAVEGHSPWTRER